MKKFFFLISIFFCVVNLNATIHVIGDSHGFFCFNNQESLITKNENSAFVYAKNNMNIMFPFCIHWLESRTMFRVGRDNIAGLNIKQFGVQEHDVVVFVFGEVDVRCHIGKQRDEKNRNEDEVIDSLATSYIATIKNNMMNYTSLKCVIMSVVPPSDKGFNPSYPFYDTLANRVQLTQKLNERLKNKCDLNGIYFLDTYSIFAQADGSLDQSLSDGIVHIHPRNNRCIKNRLIELLLLS